MLKNRIRKKLRKSILGPKNPAWEGGKTTVFCSQCGKKLKRWSSVVRENKSKLFFCNRKCRAKFEATARVDKGGPFDKHGRYSRIGICETCGKKFRRGGGRKAKYCSQTCRPKPGYRYIQGRRYEYKAIKKLKQSGFQIVIRSARSQGIFDIFAMKGNSKTREINEVRCIQVKATTSNFPVKSIVPKKERGEIVNNKSVPIMGRNIFYEIWLWRIRKGWNIYRLNWKTKEFELINEA